jgi:hypothetical protein
MGFPLIYVYYLRNLASEKRKEVVLSIEHIFET